MHGLMRTRLRELCTSDLGAVISAELVVVGTVLTIGLATGWAALQKSVVSELSDFSEAISSLDQSYSTPGYVLVGCGGCCLASSANSCYTDVDLAGYTARALPESNCCLSPIIVRDPAKPGHWHCDRCGHQHQPGDAQRSGNHAPHPHPPQPQPNRGPSGRSSNQPPQPDRANNIRPESDRPATRRDAPKTPPSTRENRENPAPSAPFTPRSGSGKPQPKPTEEPRSRKPRTSETNSEPGDSDSDSENALFMLAQLPADHPQYRPLPIPDPNVPGTPVPDPPVPHQQHPHRLNQPVHGHELHGHEFPAEPSEPHHGFPGAQYPIHQFAHPMIPSHDFPSHPQPVPYHPHRYEYRGTREPISPGYSHGYRYQHHPTHHHAACPHCQGPGTIRPGIEFHSGVRRVRVMEIPLNPYPVNSIPYNHHQPRFPEYVW